MAKQHRVNIQKLVNMENDAEFVEALSAEILHTPRDSNASKLLMQRINNIGDGERYALAMQIFASRFQNTD